MLLSKYSDFVYETGTDEAGRGCLAGPVTAAAIILPDDFSNELLNDSKQLSEKMREYLAPLIKQQALCYHITNIEPKEIDDINILNASIKAMQRCIQNLKPLPHYIIVDGNRFKPVAGIPHSCIVKGDSKYLSIAAASVLAKTYRDEHMNMLHEEYPVYNWKQNKGYPTREHREAIKKYGITKHHRKTFRLLPEQTALEFEP